MTTSTILLILLLIAGAAGPAFNMWMLLLATRRDRHMVAVMRRVDLFLETWALHWGEPPEHVREELMKIIQQKHHGHQRRP